MFVELRRVQKASDYPCSQKLKAMSGEINPASEQAKTGKVIVNHRNRNRRMKFHKSGQSGNKKGEMTVEFRTFKYRQRKANSLRSHTSAEFTKCTDRESPTTSRKVDARE